MLEFVRKGDTVQVTKLDRLARNTRHLLKYRNICKVRSGVEHPQHRHQHRHTNRKLMLTMIGAIATFEREMMLERQAEGSHWQSSRASTKAGKPPPEVKHKKLLNC
jgi:DNA invertase Pin-like site-specific DNA recombinase